MDLYLVPNNPEHTLLVSANGVAHYQIQTIKLRDGSRITFIQRPMAAPGDSIVAEIEWKDHGTPTIIRSPLLCGVGQCVGTKGIGVRALNYLYKRHRFRPTRYFIGDDGLEYCWKMVRGSGCVLTPAASSKEIACSIEILVTEGIFAGEKKHTLRIQPCSLDIDVIVLTFIIMERKRRNRDGLDLHKTAYDEDPLGDGGGSGAEADGGGEGDAEVGMGEL